MDPPSTDRSRKDTSGDHARRSKGKGNYQVKVKNEPVKKNCCYMFPCCRPKKIPVREVDKQMRPPPRPQRPVQPQVPPPPPPPLPPPPPPPPPIKEVKIESKDETIPRGSQVPVVPNPNYSPFYPCLPSMSRKEDESTSDIIKNYSLMGDKGVKGLEYTLVNTSKNSKKSKSYADISHSSNFFLETKEHPYPHGVFLKTDKDYYTHVYNNHTEDKNGINLEKIKRGPFEAKRDEGFFESKEKSYPNGTFLPSKLYHTHIFQQSKEDKPPRLSHEIMDDYILPKNMFEVVRDSEVGDIRKKSIAKEVSYYQKNSKDDIVSEKMFEVMKDNDTQRNTLDIREDNLVPNNTPELLEDAMDIYNAPEIVKGNEMLVGANPHFPKNDQFSERPSSRDFIPHGECPKYKSCVKDRCLEDLPRDNCAQKCHDQSQDVLGFRSNLRHHSPCSLQRKERDEHCNDEFGFRKQCVRRSPCRDSYVTMDKMFQLLTELVKQRAPYRDQCDLEPVQQQECTDTYDNECKCRFSVELYENCCGRKRIIINKY